MENRPLTSIRGVAALWVVLHHFAPSILAPSGFLAVGYTAVDLFFILSGLILSSVHSDLSSDGVGTFWLKRICRVYPAHVSSLLILTAVVSAPAGIAALWRSMSSLDYAGSMLLLQPYVSLRATANPVAWSVGVELGCYLLFPLSIALVRRAEPLAIGTIGILSLLLAVEWGVCDHFKDAIHGEGAMSRGAAGFGLGIVLWRVGSGFRLSALAATMVEAVGVLGAAASIAGDRPDLLPLCYAMLLFGLSYDAGLVAKTLRWQPLHWLGKVSFSIYLLHYPAMLLVGGWLQVHEPSASRRLTIGLATVALTLVASALSYEFVERPGRRMPALFARRRLRTAPSCPR